MANTDILLENNVPVIKNGDFVIGPSDEQHIEDTINAFPGWWKQHPDDGVGIKSYLGGPIDTQGISKKIKIQLQSDGYTVTNPKVSQEKNGDLIIQPNATA